MPRSLKYASDFKRKVEAGLVMANLPAAGVDDPVPFGGTGASRNGPHEQGRDAVEFVTTPKTAHTSP